jgi:hypothetical protein
MMIQNNTKWSNTVGSSNQKTDLNGNYLPYLKELQYMFDNFGRSTETHLYNVPLLVNHIKHTWLSPKDQGFVGRKITIYSPS